MVRIKLLIFLLLFFVSFSFSQNTLLPVFKKGYWSVVNTSLNLLYPYKYDDIKIAGINSALAKIGNQVYILKCNPKKEIPLNYQQINLFNEKYFIAQNGSLKGILDLEGKELIPIEYSEIGLITKELAILKNKDTAQYYHFESDKLSQPFDSIVYLMKSFYLLYNKGLFTIYDTGRNLCSQSFSGLIETHYPLFFCLKPDGKKYVVTYDVQYQYKETDYFYYFNKDPRFVIYRLQNTMHMIDNQENKECDVDFEQIEKTQFRQSSNSLGALFDEKSKSYYAITKNNKKGLMDDRFNIIVKPEYESIELTENQIVLKVNGKSGLADKNGNIIVPAKYESFSESGNYWIVMDDNKYGLLNRYASEIIAPEYQRIDPIFSNKFIVSKERKEGLIDENNRLLLPIRYENIIEAGKNLIVIANNKFGLANENGTILVNPKYESIITFNDSYYCVTEQQKKTVMDAKGKLLFPPRYKHITDTENPNLFYVTDLELSTYSYSELLNRFGIDSLLLVSDFKNRRYKTGIINAWGQILLDPVYDPCQITLDTDGNTLIAKEEQGVLVITFNEQGKLIDKTKFRNYIAVKNEKINKNVAAPTDSLPYVWRRTSQLGVNQLNGLFHINGRKVIDYYFPDVRTAPFNKELSITQGPKGRLGIVSRKTGKTMLTDSYINIEANDLKKASFMRCMMGSGSISLIDTNALFIDRGIVFIDNPGSKYMRVNKGGKANLDYDRQHQVFEQDNGALIRSSLQWLNKNAKAIKGGKWGVMDSSGTYLIKPKYSFIQIYFRGVFIAELAGKWGVINPSDSVLVDFKYDEIRFFTDSTTGHWANIPFYKVRIKTKWGVIDSAGNSIIEPKFDDVEQIYLSDRLYFKTTVDYSNTPNGLVNKEGQLVLLPKFPFIGPFKNGFAQIKESERCWKFLNTDLKTFPTTCYVEIRNFHDGLSAFRTRDGWGFMDTLGIIVIQNQYSQVGDYSEGFARIRIRLKPRFLGLVKSRQVFAIIDKTGKIIYNTKARDCSDVSNGKLIVGNNKKLTVRTLDGKKVLPDFYSQIIEYKVYGLYLVKNKKKQLALYNQQGKLIVPFGKYSQYSGFLEGLCYVSGQGSGFIDTLGNLKFMIKCSETKGFSENMAAVKIDKKWGYIDTLGQIVIPIIYADAESFSRGYAKVLNSAHKQIVIDKNNQEQTSFIGEQGEGYKKITIGNKQGITDLNGRVVVCPVSEGIGNFSEGYAVIKIPKLFGLYNSKGEMLVNDEIPQISKASNGLIKIEKTNEINYIK